MIEGLLGYHLPEMRDVYDVRVFLNPPEELRRRWKVQRDCSRRGYTTDQVLAELDRREPDSEAFIRPQQRHADMLVSFGPPGDADGDPTHLDAELTLATASPIPTCAARRTARTGLTLTEHDGERSLHIPGRHRSRAGGGDRGGDLGRGCTSPAICAPDGSGEFTIGTELHRSESLALVQLLILYHLVTAKAAIALGGDGARKADPASTEPVASV